MIALRTVPGDAAWGWLALGAQDFRRAFWPCLTYGIVFSALSLGLVAMLFQAGLASWVFALAGGFLLIAPLLATGLYEAARLLERGQRVTLGAMLRPAIASPLQLAYLGAALSFLYLAWLRIAQLLYALFSHRTFQGVQDFTDFLLRTPEGLGMAGIGTLIGAGIALFAFALAAISAPLLLERRSDVFTAMATSASALVRQPAALLLWAGAIAALTALGIATLFVGLAFVFPWIGLSTWHAYRALVPADASA